MPHPADRYDMVIVGAGFAGLYMLHSARQLGLSVLLVEKGPSVGGTWFWNRYPGLRCDVESINYSYSFSEEIDQEWSWKERYSTRDDILAYANFVADKLDLRRDIRFETAVEHAAYDEAAGDWQVRLGDGSDLRATYVVMAVGCLSTAKAPDIPGLADFEGRLLLSTAWPAEEVDFSDHRVGVIGTGSSGIQIIPIVAEQAAHLTVFQRTPSFSFPARNGPIDEAELRFVKENYPAHRAIMRKYGGPYVASPRPASEISPIEKQIIMERVYERSIPFEFLTIFADFLLDEEANRTAFDFVAQKIRERVTDPEIAEQLIPYGDYIGTRRVCIDTNYYETYNRDNVRLVNLRKTPIERIVPSGIDIVGGHVPLDTLILATGYDAMTGSIFKIDIRGRDGVRLEDKWAGGPRLNLGIMTAGFPNLFFLTGPQSPAVFSNVINSIEHHVDWVSDCIGHLQNAAKTRIEPTEAAENAWVTRVNDFAERSLVTKVNSWYMGSNVPGKPRVFPLFIEGVANYRRICAEVAEAGYEGFAIS